MNSKILVILNYMFGLIAVIAWIGADYYIITGGKEWFIISFTILGILSSLCFLISKK